MNFKQAVEDIKGKTDIVETVSSYVQLKKRGKNYIGLCPFHSEKTPSFTVSAEKNIFHCFGCGEGGNIIDFIMKIEKLEFIEALKMLGDKAGIAVETKAVDQKTKNERQLMYAINQAACKFFESNLDGAVVAYFEKRGIKKSLLEQFKIGFAKEGWDILLNYLVGRGYNPADIEKTGLIIKKDEKNEYFDRFRNRIIFPIIDPRERVLGFSGRAFGEFEPKYLNSPDSPVFHKGEVLFGLNLAGQEIKKKKYAVLVEGNVDLMMCHQHNFSNTVAPLGTAFTLAQAKLLKRFCETVVVVYDGDAAGINAAERTEAQLKEAGIQVRIAVIGDKKDPADFIAEQGEEAFLKLLKESQAALEFKIKRTIGKFNIKRIESKTKAIEAVAEILGRETNHILQKEYTKSAAALLGCDPDTLGSEIRRKSFYRHRAKSSEGMQKPPSKIDEAEKCLIRFSFEDRELLEIIRRQLGAEEFSSPDYAAIMGKIFASDPCRIEDLDSESQKKIVRQVLLNSDPVENPKLTIKDCIGTVKREQLKKKLEAARAQMQKEEAEGNLERVKALQEEFKRLGEIFRSL